MHLKKCCCPHSSLSLSLPVFRSLLLSRAQKNEGPSNASRRNGVRFVFLPPSMVHASACVCAQLRISGTACAQPISLYHGAVREAHTVCPWSCMESGASEVGQISARTSSGSSSATRSLLIDLGRAPYCHGLHGVKYIDLGPLAR